MGDENPLRTLGDYSKPSHESYMHTIELPVGNNVVMAAMVISISSDVSVESVGSSFPRVILIGSISVKVSVTLEGEGAVAVASPTEVLELDTHSLSEVDPSESSPPPVSIAPMVSPFLCLDDSESDTKMSERHVSPTPHDAMLTRHSILGHSLSRHVSLDTTVADSSTPPRFIYPQLARTPRCSEAYLRWRSSPLSTMSPAATMTSSIHATRALVPSRADLLPPRKRFRDSISPKDSVEEDFDTDVLADIEADATADEVAVDMDVVDGVMYWIDIPDGMLMPDVVERLEQVEEGQRDLEERSLIVDGERASLLEQVASLERSNATLQGTMMMERARADRFRRRMSFMESELRQIRRQSKNSLTDEWNKHWLLMRRPVLQMLSRLKVKAKTAVTTRDGNDGNGNG
ncbi:hypothetical protein Tco_0600513 [Tanacetum coccineum]|uniref:Uncharacterized protein n=1 Tax=Tanacetum coccineum TaxID=301880 RepID=A0ABQ4WC04_9ASTR